MTIHRIKLKDLNPQFIQELQEHHQHGETEVAIWLQEKPKKVAMLEDEFWKIIGLLDWEQKSRAGILEPSVSYLTELSVDAIKGFEDILSEKLYRLDGQVYAENIGESVYQGEGIAFSVDTFLYARCYVVACGQNVYQQVLNSPENMPKDQTFEPLLGLASAAYQRKTGEKFDYIPAYIYETFANAAAWGGKDFLEKLLFS